MSLGYLSASEMEPAPPMARLALSPRLFFPEEKTCPLLAQSFPASIALGYYGAGGTVSSEQTGGFMSRALKMLKR